jgi:fructose-specific component phosphotransferase system IIB-like protein
MGDVKLAEDKYTNKMQFAHIDTANAANVTTSSASFAGKQVVITPVSADAYIVIGAGSQSTPTTNGKLVKLGTSYTTIIRAGEQIAASSSVNVCPLGEA